MTSHVFMSYSSKDQDFALRLADDLQHFYKVWIDRKRLQAGTQWEREIERAIDLCSVFLVIVSPSSNNSSWVGRETMYAETKQKYTIPVLIQGDLPLRLIERQYIDFRGDYNGAFADLLKIMKQRIDPSHIDDDEINRILGAALRAYLSDDFTMANNLFNQAVAIQTDFSTSLARFWGSVSGKFQTKMLSSTLMPKISIHEQAKRSDKKKYPQGPAFEWSLEIDADYEVLDKIDYVKYTLHSTFPDPVRVIRDRQSRFRMNTIGWGMFELPIEIHFVDGTVGTIWHMLTFRSADSE